MTFRYPYTVLFLSADNAGRSLMAEALLNLVGGARFQAFSAGLRPAAAANRMALECLYTAGLPMSDLRPKGLAMVRDAVGSSVDLIVTMGDVDPARCDLVEADLDWAGDPQWKLWPVDNPAADGTRDDGRRLPFQRALQQIETQIVSLLAMPSTGAALPSVEASLVGGARRQLIIGGLAN